MSYPLASLSALLLLVCTNAEAAQLKPDFVACESEETFVAYRSAVAANDKQSMEALTSFSCGTTSMLMMISKTAVVLARSTTVIKVQVSNSASRMIAWTYPEAVQD